MTPLMMPAAPAVAVPVGSALREARLAAGLTIEQLAAHAGIGSATVERIEHGRVTPRRATLLALGLVLGPHDRKPPVAVPEAFQHSPVERRHGQAYP